MGTIIVILSTAFFLGLLFYALKWNNTKIVRNYIALAHKFGLQQKCLKKNFSLQYDPYVEGKIQGYDVMIGSKSTLVFKPYLAGGLGVKSTTYIALSAANVNNHFAFKFERSASPVAKDDFLKTADSNTLRDFFFSKALFFDGDKERIQSLFSDEMMKELLRMNVPIQINSNNGNLLYSNDTSMIESDAERKSFEAALPVMLKLIENIGKTS